MRPNARGVAILLGSVSLAQAAAHRRQPRAGNGFDKRQDLGAQTVTVVQTVTVGAADAGIVGNNTVTVTVTEQAAGAGALASTVTITNCAPDQVQGVASGADLAAGASVTPPVVGGAAAGPGGQDIPTGGIGVVIVDIPASLRTTTREGSSAPTPPAAAPAAPAQPPAQQPAQPPALSPPGVQNPASDGTLVAPPGTLQPLPGLDSSATLQSPPGATLQAPPGAFSPGTILQPLPTDPGAPPAGSLLPLPSPPGAAPTDALQPLPNPAGAAPTDAFQPLPTDNALQPLPTVDPAVIPPGGIPGGVVDPANPLDSTLNLGGVAPTPVAADGSFGGIVSLAPLAPGAVPGAPQPVVDPAATVTPGLTNAGAQEVNIDLSGVVLNSQLNLGNLVQPTGTPVPVI